MDRWIVGLMDCWVGGLIREHIALRSAVSTIHLSFNPSIQSSELDGIVQAAALGATRAVHVRIVSIDVATAGAAEDPILARPRLEAATPQFGINGRAGQAGEQHEDIGENQG